MACVVETITYVVGAKTMRTTTAHHGPFDTAKAAAEYLRHLEDTVPHTSGIVYNLTAPKSLDEESVEEAPAEADSDKEKTVEQSSHASSDE